MPSVTIKVEGADKLKKVLSSAQQIALLERPMDRAVKRLQKDMADYPEQAPGSSYRRTGTLGRRWTTAVARIRNGVQGKVGNNTRYAPWVQSERFQARMHRGRWQTDGMVLERNIPRIVRDFERTIRKALK